MKRLRHKNLIVVLLTLELFTLPTMFGQEQQSEWTPWRSVTKEEVTSLLRQTISKVIGNQPLPDGDPRVRKIQATIDRFHQTLQAKYPGAPAPRLMILNSVSDRMFTVSRPFCFPVYLTWSNRNLPKAGLLSSSALGMQLNAELPDPESCDYVHSLSIGEKTQVIKRALPFSEDCLSVSTGTFIKLQVDIKPSCISDYEKTHKNSQLNAFSSAGYFSSAQALNWIFITTKALENQTEEILIARLAHELVHYYESHSSKGQGFDYFYKIDLDNYRHRALIKSDDPLIELAATVKQIDPVKLPPYSEERRYLILAYEEDLGYFTAEQHADELAISYLQAIGADPRALIEALFATLRLKTNRGYFPLPPSIVPGFLTCFENFQGGFTEKVGVGLYHEPHHTECFRIYNLYKLLYD